MSEEAQKELLAAVAEVKKALSRLDKAQKALKVETKT